MPVNIIINSFTVNGQPAEEIVVFNGCCTPVTIAFEITPDCLGSNFSWSSIPPGITDVEIGKANNEFIMAFNVCPNDFGEDSGEIQFNCNGELIYATQFNLYELISTADVTVTSVESSAYLNAIPGQEVSATITLTNNANIDAIVSIDIEETVIIDAVNTVTNSTINVTVPANGTYEYIHIHTFQNCEEYSIVGSICSGELFTFTGTSYDFSSYVDNTILPTECGCYTDLLSTLHSDSLNHCTTYISELSKKLNATSFFGIFDKSKQHAFALNDIQNLMLLLEIIHYNKLEDAMASCTCRLSKHPKHYINKYKLDCIVEQFTCRGHDITPILKSFAIDKIYLFKGYNIHDTTGLMVPNIELLPGDAFSFCSTEGEVNVYPEECCVPIPDPEPAPSCLVCCIEHPGVNDSDWLYDSIKAYVEEECSTCEQDYLYNLSEIGDVYTLNINEDFYCQNFYTHNLDEEIC